MLVISAKGCSVTIETIVIIWFVRTWFTVLGYYGRHCRSCVYEMTWWEKVVYRARKRNWWQHLRHRLWYYRWRNGNYQMTIPPRGPCRCGCADGFTRARSWSMRSRCSCRTWAASVLLVGSMTISVVDALAWLTPPTLIRPNLRERMDIDRMNWIHAALGG